MQLDFPVLVPKIDAIFSRGLCQGIGHQGEQVCVEAAICEAMGLPHNDDPPCVAKEVRAYKIGLNDCSWSSPAARAAGLRDLAIAQLGTESSLNYGDFTWRMQQKTIRVILPRYFRELLVDLEHLAAADVCEREGTTAAAQLARRSVEGRNELHWTVRAVARRCCLGAPDRVPAPTVVTSGDKYLLLASGLALETLRELGSPGVAYLDSLRDSGSAGHTAGVARIDIK